MDSRYIAGLFDGEGYIIIPIYIYKNRPNRKPRMQLVAGINMSYKPVILELAKQYPGHVSVNRHDLKNPNHRPMFNWVVASQKAATFLRDIYPYLIVKKDEVTLALEFQDSVDKYQGKLGYHYGSHPDRDSIVEYRINLANRIKALKKRPFSPLLNEGPN